MPNKSHIFNYLYWLMSPIIILLILESLLTVFWKNPYNLNNNFAQYTRFHIKDMLAYANINNRLYKGNYRIRFAINNQMAITDGLNYTNKIAISLGGSTTESALVPEGQRWPDLLKIPTLNYGVSANTSIDGFYNLKFLLENHIINPKYVFIMYGINDLRAFLLKGADKFKLEGWNEPPVNSLVVIDAVEQEIWRGIRIKDSSILSALKYYSNNFFGRDFYQSYSAQRQTQESLENMTHVEFKVFLQDLKYTFLPMRKSIYLELYNLIKEYKLRLIFLTQPHAYRTDFQAWQNDLRLFPVLQNSKMTIKQASTVMDIFNAQTRELAQLLNQKIIDVDACFAKLSPSKLFYDSVHYTLKGSKQFAKCVNQFLP